MKCRYIIVKRHACDKEKKKSSEAMHDGPMISKYMGKHGSHFTSALAEEASRKMVNSNGKAHTWSAHQIHEAVIGMGLTIPRNVTLGDVTYLSNMYYSDFYPEIMDEQSCVKAAIKSASDPDGYEGMAFRRWLADLSTLHKDFNFSTFI